MRKNKYYKNQWFEYDFIGVQTVKIILKLWDNKVEIYVIGGRMDK